MLLTFTKIIHQVSKIIILKKGEIKINRHKYWFKSGSKYIAGWQAAEWIMWIYFVSKLSRKLPNFIASFLISNHLTHPKLHNNLVFIHTLFNFEQFTKVQAVSSLQTSLHPSHLTRPHPHAVGCKVIIISNCRLVPH